MATTTKFIIAGTHRTGTTLIRTSLSSHPDILCHGEVFLLGKRPYRDKGGYWQQSRKNIKARFQSLLLPSMSTAKYLQELYATDTYSAIGLKLMLRHCEVRPYIWPLLLEHEIKVLLVKRRNCLKTLVSRCAAAKSGVYHVSYTLRKPSSVENWIAPRIDINTATLISDLDAIETENTNWQTRLVNQVDYIDVIYEDYVQDQESGNEEMLQFLRVKQSPLHSDLRKVNPDELEKLVRNYSEVVRALKHTKYAIYLDI